MSFQNEVQPIIISNRTESGGHGNSGNRGGLQLTAYDDVMKRVSAANPRGSSLYTAITRRKLKGIRLL